MFPKFGNFPEFFPRSLLMAKKIKYIWGFHIKQKQKKGCLVLVSPFFFCRGLCCCCCYGGGWCWFGSVEEGLIHCFLFFVFRPFFIFFLFFVFCFLFLFFILFIIIHFFLFSQTNQPVQVSIVDKKNGKSKQEQINSTLSKWMGSGGGGEGGGEGSGGGEELQGAPGLVGRLGVGFPLFVLFLFLIYLIISFLKILPSPPSPFLSQREKQILLWENQKQESGILLLVEQEMYKI